MRILFGFLSFHPYRRIRYEVYGPRDHIPQASTDVVEEPAADADPEPCVPNTAAHDSAITDEWESDCDTPETQGAVARITRSMSLLLMRRRGHAQAVPKIYANNWYRILVCSHAVTTSLVQICLALHMPSIQLL